MPTPLILLNGTQYNVEDFDDYNYATTWPNFFPDLSVELARAKGFGALSTSSVAIGTGEKTFTLTSADVVFPVDSIVRVYRAGDPAEWMVGTVTAQDGADLTIEVPGGMTAGAGTHTDWVVGYAAPGFDAPLPVAFGGTGLAALAAHVATLLGSADTAAAAAALSLKRIRQMQVGTLATAFSTASSSPVDTGLQVSITPLSASSKVLLLCSYAGGIALNKLGGTDHYAHFYIDKDAGTTLTQVRMRLIGDVNSGANNAGIFTAETMIYVDTPGDTSAHTYKLRAFTDGQTTTNAYVNPVAGSSTQVAHFIAIEVDA